MILTITLLVTNGLSLLTLFANHFEPLLSLQLSSLHRLFFLLSLSPSPSTPNTSIHIQTIPVRFQSQYVHPDHTTYCLK